MVEQPPSNWPKSQVFSGNIDELAEYFPQCGYLIEKTYLSMYREYAPKYGLDYNAYGIPRTDKSPDEFLIQYRGSDRNPLTDNEEFGELAEIRLAEIRKLNKSDEDSALIFNYQDALDVFTWVETKEDFEIIWIKIAETTNQPVTGFVSIGFEPTWFNTEHFSPIADSMFFPRWHGTDDGGTLFQPYFSKLNQYGLFNTNAEALDFTLFYISLDWTEIGTYLITEVFIQK